MLAVAFAVLIPIFKISGGLGLSIGACNRIFRPLGPSDSFSCPRGCLFDAYRLPVPAGAEFTSLNTVWRRSQFLVNLGTPLGSLLGGAEFRNAL